MADPLTGLGGSVNAAPTKKQNPLAGLRGGTNAGVTQRFPMGLNHPSSGLRGVTGAAEALGHIPAPKFTAPALKGLAGGTSQFKGLSGSIYAGHRLGPVPQLKPFEGTKLNAAQLKGAPPSLPSRPLSQKEVASRQRSEVQAGGAKSNLLAAAEPKGVHVNVGKVVENIPKSTLTTITGTIPALYKTGEAAVEAAKGNLKPAEGIAKGLGEVAAHPGQALEKEPVPIALMFSGAVGAFGRAAGAAMRAGTFGDRAVQIADMRRTPMHIYGQPQGPAIINPARAAVEKPNDLLMPRTYSPDIIHKGVQRSVEKFYEAMGHNPNMATGEQANRYLTGGGLISHYALKPFKGAIKPGLIDMSAGAIERARRTYTRHGSEFLQAIKPKIGHEAVPLFVEGTIRRADTVPEDLQKRLDSLQSERDSLATSKERRENDAQQRQIQTLQKDKKFLAEPQHAENAAREYADHMRPIEERMVELGILEPDQLNARNVPFALAHGHADKYNTEPGKHPIVEELKNLEAERRNAIKRFQRAMGYREGRAYSKSVKPVSKGHTAPQEIRNEIRDLGAQIQERKYAKQALRETGEIDHEGKWYPYLEKDGLRVHHDGPNGLNEIVAHELKDRRLGFISHKEVNYGAALHARVGTAPASEKVMRTGESYKKGLYNSSWEGLNHQVYKNMNKIAGQEGRNEMLNRFGIGRYFSKEEAKRAGELYADTAEGRRLKAGLKELVPVPLGSEKVLSRGLISPRPLGGMLNQFLPSSDRMIAEMADQPTHTLMHEDVIKRINAHDALNNRGEDVRALQWFTNKWRSAALYTSPRWMLGNPQEHAIRLAFASINPFAILGTGRAVKLGRAMLHEWEQIAADPSRSEAARMAARGFHADWEAGTHYGSLAMNSVRRQGNELLGEGEVRSLQEAFADTAPAHVTAEGWSKWKGGIGGFMDKIERNTKAAFVGKATLNETRKFTQEWRELINREDQAVKAYAEAKLSPNEAAKLGEDIMEMAGNWSTLTPFVRRAVQSWSPFGLWWLNSMKFVFKTLPRDHPMKTAALAAMIVGTGAGKGEEELQPEYLAGGITMTLPFLGKITLTPGYYSPFGIGTEATKTALDMALPQVKDTAAILLKRKPLDLEKVKGEQLPEAVVQAGANLGIGVTPFARQVAALAERGGRHDYASMNPLAIEPGTARPLSKTAIKLVSPFRFNLPPRSEEATGGGRERVARPERERPERPERTRPERPERVR